MATMTGLAGRARFVVALAALAIAGAGMVAAGRGGDGIYPCVSRPSEMRELGFSTRGKVGEVVVKPGDAVKAGDLLIRLEDAVQRHVVAAATIQAADDSQVRLSEKGLAYRETELKLLEAARAEDGATEARLREAQFRTEQAKLELASATTTFRLNGVTLDREKARLDEMAIKSPITGTVLDIRKHEGETVDEGTAALTVVAVDPLWLDVNIPMREAGNVSLGQAAEVVWEDTDDQTPMAGKVIYKAPAGNAGARQLQMRIEVPNPKRIPSGMHGKVRFLAGGQASPTPAAGPGK
jgi:RND family efflux transporter MFP subunit